VNDDRYYEAVLERFIRYISIDTQSSTDSEETPSTHGQKILGRMIAEEMQQMGLAEVLFDEETGIAYGKIPARGGCTLPAFGLICHLDTAPDAPGGPVKAKVVKKYSGGRILLNEERDIFMDPTEFPAVNEYLGEDLIVTDGTTLLGGDDKAGIASVLTMAEELMKGREKFHCPLSLAFTPDEEVGGLAKDLDLKRFGADCAYTVDGDHLGYYTDETFYASTAAIEIEGRSVHTATAKNIMINASDLAAEFVSMLPKSERPQTTSGRQGFYHVVSIASTCESAKIVVNIRDHDRDRFREREGYILQCAEKIEAEAGNQRVKCIIRPTYNNMKEILKECPSLTEDLVQAIQQSGIEPQTEPFRGGTDGSALTWRGLPCPNLSAGYENAHGRFEFVPVSSMVKNVEILLNLCRIKSEKQEGRPCRI